MPWVATETFDSYSTSVDLNGLSGGSGWTGNWTTINTGTFTTGTAPAGGQGGVAVTSSTDESQYNRSFSALASGIVTWEMRTSYNNPNDFIGCLLRESGSGRCYVRFGDGGIIKAYDNVIPGLYVDLQAYSVDTWYRITLEFGHVANRYRVKVDAGAYSADLVPVGGGFSVFDAFCVDHSASNAGANTFWVDDIRSEVVPAITDAPELIRTVHSGIRFR